MEFFKTELKNNVLWITFNRPKKHNAITKDMFLYLTEIFQNAVDDDKIGIVVLTGGDHKFYSAGADFSPAQFAELASGQGGSHGYKSLSDALITFPKPVIALVNGPAVGIAVTTLALMDLVIASDSATFHCPFSQIGLCPEAASSKTFSDIMGHQKAAAMALFSEKFTAQEAFIAGLVTKVLPASKFQEESAKIIERYSKLSTESMQAGKKLMRTVQVQDQLLAVNRHEEKILNERFTSEDTISRLAAKFAPQSKL